MTDLLSRLSAHALEKYPPDVDNVGFYEDGCEILRDANVEARDNWLEIATEVIEKFGREIAEEAWDKSHIVTYQATDYKMETGVSIRTDKVQKDKAEYLNKQFPEPKNEADEKG